MDIRKLSGLMSAENARISDSRRKNAVTRSLKAKLMDTESTEEAVDVAVAALEDESPEDVITAVVQVLSSTVDELAEQVKDTKRNLGRSASRKSGARGRFSVAKFKRSIMDTESTEEAVDVAVQALETADPEEVVRASIELLGGVVDELSNQ